MILATLESFMWTMPKLETTSMSMNVDFDSFKERWILNSQKISVIFNYWILQQRHKQKDRTRSCSPHVVHYTDHEATSLSEKLKSDETFFKAVQTLIAWLERGDCTKRNANIFYSMIQNTNSHVRRLLNEKSQHEDELKTAKEKYNKVMSKVIDQCK